MHICKTIGLMFLWIIFISACAEEESLSTKKSKRTHLVEVTVASMDAHSHVSTHVGTLRASRATRIFNQEEGRIKKLPYSEGDAINAGDILVELDDQLLSAEHNKAMATRRQAEVDLQRLTGMVSKQLISKEEKVRAETALEVAKSEETVLKTRLSFTKIHAPYSGVISQRLVEPGDVAARHTHLLSLYDPGSLVTEIAVSELLMPFISRGDKVNVMIDALGSKQFKGTVNRIHPVLDEKTRRSIIEIEITPVPEGAMPGQFCRVTMSTQAQQRIVVPFKALQRDRKGEYVFIVGKGDKVERSSVRSGLKLEDKVEILEGLAENDRVIVKGFLGLHQGKKVKEVISQGQGQ